MRPAVVVEDHELFADNYPNVVLVPLADDPRLAIPDLALAIEPTEQNGCSKPCWALSHCVVTTSARRLRATELSISETQLAVIRRQIAVALGLSR